MAVLERIDLALVQELLRAVTGMGSELQAVSFENQVAAPDTVPDAQISARFSWWFETKTETDAYAREGHGRTQLREHSKLLHDPDALLFVITPDPVRPAWFETLDGLADATYRERILWFSFRDLAEAIGKLITDPARVTGEQTGSFSQNWCRYTRRMGCSRLMTRSLSPPMRRGRNTSGAPPTSASPTRPSAQA